MLIEILGSGGAFTIPKPLCNCIICNQARVQGIPYSRSGPSVFIHGPDILIDTPEEIKDQLNRSQVKRINACFYSHWHPDHVMGLRVWNMNREWLHWPPKIKNTKIYLPQQVVIDFKSKLHLWKHLEYLERQGLVNLVQLNDGAVVTIDEYQIKPFKLQQDYVYAFLLTTKGKRLLIVMDELFLWEPSVEVQGVDLAIIPMGIQEVNPITKKRQFNKKHPVLKSEATFEQTLNIVRKLNAKRVVMTHISEHDGLSFDDFNLLQKRPVIKALNVEFAYDNMTIEV